MNSVVLSPSYLVLDADQAQLLGSRYGLLDEDALDGRNAMRRTTIVVHFRSAWFIVSARLDWPVVRANESHATGVDRSYTIINR